MNLLARAWDGLKSLLGVGAKSQPLRADPRRYLAGAQPGLWASNHFAEAQRCEGWEFVAIRSHARMCSQATLHVKEVGTPGEKATRIKDAIRWCDMIGDQKGARRWKRKLKRLKRKVARRKAQRKRRKSQQDGKPQRDQQPRHAGDVREDAPPDHPLRRLLERPNPEWSLATLLFAADQQLGLTGSCLLWRIREMGVTRELYVLPTGLCTPRAPTPAYPLGSYYLAPLSTFGMVVPDEWAQGTLGQSLLTGVEIDFRDVKPIRWPHPLLLSDGLSTLAATRLWVDVATQQDLANFSEMVNAPRPGMIFEIDKEADPHSDDVTRFEEDLRADVAGSMNAGKHLLLPKGVKGTPRSRSPLDMDYDRGEQRSMMKILASHGMTPIACGVAESGSYAAYWASLKQSTDLSVRPTLNLIAGEINEFVGGEYDGPRVEAVLEPPAIDDAQLQIQQAKLKEEQLRTNIAAGNVQRVDEFRKERGWPPLGGDEGKQFVGVKTTISSEDADPGKPGFQADDDRDGDKPGSDEGTGTREEHRDAPPGRQDGAGKHSSNGVAHNGRRW